MMFLVAPPPSKNIRAEPPTSALIELHYIALWGSHYSLGLICNDWLSSGGRAQMDSVIDYTQSGEGEKTTTWNYEKVPSRLCNSPQSSPWFLSRHPFYYWSACVCVLVCLYVCRHVCGTALFKWRPILQLCWRSIRTDSSIEPPSLHRLGPSTHNKISLWIRTFMKPYRERGLKSAHTADNVKTQSSGRHIMI